MAQRKITSVLNPPSGHKISNQGFFEDWDEEVAPVKRGRQIGKEAKPDNIFEELRGEMKQLDQAKRSRAAQKGWETRKANEADKARKEYLTNIKPALADEEGFFQSRRFSSVPAPKIVPVESTELPLTRQEIQKMNSIRLISQEDELTDFLKRNHFIEIDPYRRPVENMDTQLDGNRDTLMGSLQSYLRDEAERLYGDPDRALSEDEMIEEYITYYAEAHPNNFKNWAHYPKFFKLYDNDFQNEMNNSGAKGRKMLEDQVTFEEWAKQKLKDAGELHRNDNYELHRKVDDFLLDKIAFSMKRHIYVHYYNGDKVSDPPERLGRTRYYGDSKENYPAIHLLRRTNGKGDYYYTWLKEERKSTSNVDASKEMTPAKRIPPSKKTIRSISDSDTSSDESMVLKVRKTSGKLPNMNSEEQDTLAQILNFRNRQEVIEINDSDSDSDKTVSGEPVVVPIVPPNKAKGLIVSIDPPPVLPRRYEVGNFPEEETKKVEIAPSQILTDTGKPTGYGLFALKNFRRGENIVEYRGHKVLWSKLKDPRWKSEYVIRLNNEWGIDPTHDIYEFGRYANDPIDERLVNAEFVTDDKKIMIKAITNIRAGSEILVSYGINYWMDPEQFVKLNLRSRQLLYQKHPEIRQFLKDNFDPLLISNLLSRRHLGGNQFGTTQSRIPSPIQSFPP